MEELREEDMDELAGHFATLPFEMVEKIFSYLSVRDVKRVRMVNSFWREMSTTRYHQLVFQILSPSNALELFHLGINSNCCVDVAEWISGEGSPNHPGIFAFGDMNFVKSLKVKYKWDPKMQLYDENRRQFFETLLKEMSPYLTEMTLQIDYSAERNRFWFPKYLGNGELRNLTVLELRLDFIVLEAAIPDDTSITTNLLQNTPNITRFSCSGDLLSLKILKLIQRQNNLWTRLKTLECHGSSIQCALPITFLCVIRNLRRPVLKKICLYGIYRNHGFLIGQILEKNKASLEYFHFSVSIGPVHYPREVSCMPKLRTFSYESPCGSRDNYFGIRKLIGNVRNFPQKFPKLRTLRILLDHEGSQEEYEVIFQTPKNDGIIISGVRWLDIKYPKADEGPATSSYLAKQLSKLFPRVHNPCLNRFR